MKFQFDMVVETIGGSRLLEIMVEALLLVCLTFLFNWEPVR